MAEGEGIVSDLTLTIDAALRSVDELAAALDKVTTDVVVTLDTAGITDQLSGAVAGADTTATVTGDASEVTSSIDAAVTSADTTTVVTGDANEVTSAIDAAVGAADSTVTIDADTTPAQDALAGLDSSAQSAAGSITSAAGAAGGGAQSLDVLAASAGAASGSASGLTGVLGPAGIAIASIAGATGGLFDAAVTAAGGEQRLTQAFGDQKSAIETINVGNLNIDLATLAQELGTSRAEIDNTAATLQQFGTNAGFSASQAEATTEQFIGLAARAVALNPSLGSLSDVADTMAARLARGGRFAQSLGISLTQSEIAARAMTNTGKENATELTIYEKAAAAAQIATEKYGSTINEVIVQGSQNPIVQLQALKAEFTNAAEEIGKPLIAPIFETLRTALPLAVTLAKTFADVSGALLPILNALISVIGFIPQPVLSAVGTFVTLGFVIEQIGTKAVEAGLITQSALGAIALPLAILTAAYVAFTVVQNENAASQAETQAALQRSAAGLDDTTRSVEDSLVAIAKQADTTGILRDSLDKAGESFQGLAQAQLQGTASTQAYEAAAIDASKANGASISDLSQLAVAMVTQTKANEDAAKAKLDDAVASGLLNDAQVTAAENSHKNADGTTNYLGALDALHGPLLAAKLAQDSANQAADADIIAKQKQIDATNAEKKTLQDLASSAPAVALALGGVNDAITVGQGGALEALAINIDKSKLTQDQVKAIADSMGVTADQLTTFVKGVNDAINQMTTDATAKLPTTAGAIDAIVKVLGGAPEAINPQTIIDALDKNIQAIADFQTNLEFLQQHGGDNLELEASKEGPQITAALVAGIKQGGDTVGQALDAKLGEAQTATQNFTAWFQTTEGPRLALATGIVGQLATDQFGQHFKIEAPTQAQLDQAHAFVQNQGGTFADALRFVAGGGAVAYEQGIGAIPGTTQVTINGALTTIGANAPGVQTAGAGLGGAADTGFGQGIAPLATHGTDVATNIYESLTADEVHRSINEAMNDLVSNIVTGLVFGLDDPGNQKATSDAMVRMVNATIDAGQKAAGARSPSTVMIQLGQDMGAGLAIGLNSSVSLVTSAAGNVINAAIPNLSRTNLPTGGQSNITVASGAVVINVPPGTSEAQAKALGRQAGQGLLESIAGRGLAVDVRTI